MLLTGRQLEPRALVTSDNSALNLALNSVGAVLKFRAFPASYASNVLICIQKITMLTNNIVSETI